MRQIKVKLDKYEQGIENAIKKGEFVKAQNFSTTKKMFETVAKAIKKSPTDEILQLKKGLPNIPHRKILLAIRKGRA